MNLALLIKSIAELVSGGVPKVLLVLLYMASFLVLVVIRLQISHFNTQAVALFMFYGIFWAHSILVVLVNCTNGLKTDDIKTFEAGMVLAYVYVMAVPVYVNALVYVLMNTTLVAVAFFCCPRDNFFLTVSLSVVLTLVKYAAQLDCIARTLEKQN